MAVLIFERADLTARVSFGQVQIFLARIENQVRIRGRYMHPSNLSVVRRKLIEPHACVRPSNDDTTLTSVDRSHFATFSMSPAPPPRYSTVTAMSSSISCVDGGVPDTAFSTILIA